MNNRQAALIAAANVASNMQEATQSAHILELWLEELDAAETEKRLPVDFTTLRQVALAATDWAGKQGSPIATLRFGREHPNVTLANGKSYDWHGSWSRVS